MDDESGESMEPMEDDTTAENWRILLEQRFAARTPLPTATSTLKLGR